MEPMPDLDCSRLYKKWDYRILQYQIPQYSADAAMSVIPGGYIEFGRANNNLTNATHIHKCYELCFSLGGCGEYICGGKTYCIEPYSIFIADPDVLHEIRLPKDNCDGFFSKYYYLVSFNGISEIRGNGGASATVSDANIIANFMLSHKCVVPGMHDFIMGHLRRLSEFGDGNDGYIDIYHETYSFIIGALYRLAASAKKAESCIFETELEVEPARANRVTYETSLRLISTMIYERITVADIAERVHTSVRNLEYLYRRYMNMTVKDYIISMKMSAAAAFLRMNAKVSETAERLCYEDVSTFTRLFKKHMGVTPKKYQQLCNSDENVFGSVYREYAPEIEGSSDEKTEVK